MVQIGHPFHFTPPQRDCIEDQATCEGIEEPLIDVLGR